LILIELYSCRTQREQSPGKLLETILTIFVMPVPVLTDKFAM
jgi:hypothetical protein